MKKQPIDSLTAEDKYTIEKYIFLYANCKCGPLDLVLQEWNKSKRRLYHALGNKLRLKKQIKIKKDTPYVTQMLNNIYHYYPIYYASDITLFKNHLELCNKKNFFEDFCLFVITNSSLNDYEKKSIINMFKYAYLIKGYIDYDFKLQNFSFSVRKGAKTIRTIQKCIKALKYSNISLFNEWKNKVSNVHTNEIENATLVISIHPIDFMTMSDNNCNWTSCMSWITRGCYNAGTIEMMNSNVATVAYLETKHPFKIRLDEDNTLNIPNKSWRSLIYCNKQIVLAGKSYPYAKDELSKCAIHFMQEIVKESFGWEYKFQNQLYKDISSFCGNSFLKYNCIPTANKHKRIVVYTNGMYNDLIEDTDRNYWCSRNYTKGLRLSLSGKLTCLCCGKTIKNSSWISSPDDINNKKICSNCDVAKRCPICDTISWDINSKNLCCSNECKQEAIVIKGQNLVIKKTDFLNKITGKKYFIFAKDEKTQERIVKIIQSFIDGTKKDFTLDLFYKDGLINGRDFIMTSINKNLQPVLNEKIPFSPWWTHCHFNFDSFTVFNFLYHDVQHFFYEIQKPIQYYSYDKEGRVYENSYSLIGRS